MPASAASSRSGKSSRKAVKITRTRKPAGMSLEDWQVALRREFGRQQKFRLVNVGQSEIFSDFNVSNPQSGRTYRASIRGGGVGENRCTCPDFAVNTLGTCKHIEFALSRLERRVGGKRALARGYRPAFSEVYLRYGARREVALRRGNQLPPDSAGRIKPYLCDDDVLRPEAFERFEQFVEEVGRDGHEVRCHDDAVQFVAQFRDRKALAARIEKQFPEEENSPAFDNLLKVRLYPYQRRGALFAARAGRSLLADDMGLGKTIQALAATEILAAAAGVERVLIVAPTSLKHQWKQEIEKFTARDAVVVQGLTASRQRLY